MNQPLLLVSAAILCYLTAILAQRVSLLHSSLLTKLLGNSSALVALVVHGMLLHQWIDIGAGQNLTALNLFSLVAWATGILTLLIGFIRPMEYLKLIIFSLAVISIILAFSSSDSQVIETGNNPRQLIHILLSTAAFSVFYLAGFQALLLAVQEFHLHHRKLTPLTKAMPSLEAMETLLFQMLTLGFILLTAVVVTGIAFFYAQFNILLLSKLLISIVAWLIFSILFLGRRFYGWRGQAVARWTLAGVGLVTFLYFGNQFL